MKSVAALLALVSSASAFAPSQVARTSTNLNEFANGMVGGEGPEPIPFAPSGTSKNFDLFNFAEVCSFLSFFLSLFWVFLKHDLGDIETNDEIWKMVFKKELDEEKRSSLMFLWS
jgi:hypothetical protein